MSQPTLNASNSTQSCLRQFKDLDKDNLGYLDVAQVRAYFKSQYLPEDDLTELASHPYQGRLTAEQFATAINLSYMKKNDDIEYIPSKFTCLALRCKEAIESVEKDKRVNFETGSKDTLREAFKKLENFMKRYLESLEKLKDSDDSFTQDAASFKLEKMPGSFDFDEHAVNDACISVHERSVATPLVVTPAFLKDPSLGNAPDRIDVTRNEKEPNLDSSLSPSPQAQMNDTSLGSDLKPIFKGSSNGDDVGPNKFLHHANDSYRSNVLNLLRNPATDYDQLENLTDKEREALADYEADDCTALGALTSGIELGKSNNANTKNSADLESRQTTDSAFSTSSAHSSQRSSLSLDNIDESAITPSSAGGTGTSLSNLESDAPHLDDSYGSKDKSHAHDSFQGGLGGNSSKPYIKNAKDAELKPEDHPSISAEQEEVNRKNGVARDSDTLSHTTHLKLVKSNETSKDEPYASKSFKEVFNGIETEPYIQNDKGALLKTEDQAGRTNEDATDNKSLGSTLSQIGAGAASIADAAALSLSGHDENKRNGSGATTFMHERRSRNVYSPSLSFANSLKNTSSTSGDSNQVLSVITNKAGAGTLRDARKENSETVRDISANSADAIGENDKDLSTSLTLSSPKDVKTLVDRDTPLSSKIDNRIGIQTSSNANNGSFTPGREDFDSAVPTDSLKNDGEHVAFGSSSISDSIIVASDINLGSSTSNTSSSRSSSTQKHDNEDNFNNDVANTSGFSGELFGRSKFFKPVPRSIPTISDRSNRTSFSAPASKKATAPSSIRSSGIDICQADLHANFEGNTKDALNKISLGASGDKGQHDSYLHVNANNGLNSKDFDIQKPKIKCSINTSAFEAKVASEINDTVGVNNGDGSIPMKADASESIIPKANKGLPTAKESADFSTDINDSPNSSSDSVLKSDLEFDRKLDKSINVLENNEDSPESGINFNTNVGKSDISSSIDNLSAGIKGLQNSINGSISKTDAEIRSIQADFKGLDTETTGDADIERHFPSIGSDLKNSISGVSKVDGKLDESIETSKLNNMSAKEKINLDTNVNGSFLGKLDANLKSSQCDIDEDLQRSKNTPDISGKLPPFNTDLRGSKHDENNTIDGSVDNPDFKGKVSAIDSDTQNSDIDVNLGKSINTSKIGGELKSLEANLDVDNSGVSVSLGKLSSGFKGLKENIAGVDSPKTSSKLPSLNADLKRPEAEIPKVDVMVDSSVKTPNVGSKILSFDAGLNSRNTDNKNDGFTNTPGVGRNVPSLDGKLSSVDSDVNVPVVEVEVNANPSSFDISETFDKLSGSLKGVGKETSKKFDISANTPDFDSKVPLFDADINNPIDNLTNVDGEIPVLNADSKLDNGELSSTKGGLNSPKANIDARVDIDRPNMSSSLGKLSTGVKELQDDVASKFEKSIDGSGANKELSAVDVNLKGTAVEIPNAGGKLDKPSSSSSIDDDLKIHELDVNVDHPDLSGSLAKLSSGAESLKGNISGKFNGLIDANKIDKELPSLNVDTKSYNMQGNLDSSIKASDIDDKLPSASTNERSLPTNLPKAERSIHTPNINIKLPSADNEFDTSKLKLDAQVDADSSNFPGSVRFSSGLKEFKNTLSEKFDGSFDSVDVNKKIPSLETDLNMPNVTKNLDNPSIDGNIPSLKASSESHNTNLPGMEGTINASKFEDKLPSVDSKFDSSKIGLDGSINVDGPNVPGALGKISSGVKGLKDNVSGKINGSVGTPDIHKEFPASSAGMKSSESNGTFNGSVDVPDVNGKTPSFKTDSKSLIVNAPDVDGSIDVLDLDGKFPSVNGKFNPPEADFNNNLDASKHNVSGSLGKFSSGLKSIKDGISGELNGSVEAPDIHKKLPSLDANIQNPNLDGNVDGSFDVPKIDGKVTSLTTDINCPNANLSDASGSITTAKPDGKLTSIDGKFDSPNVDVGDNVNAKKSSPSSALNKLSSSLKSLKNEISGKLDGSFDTPDIHKELPAIGNANVQSPDLDGKFDGSINTSSLDMAGNMNSGNGNIEGKSPAFDTEIPSIEVNLKSPKEKVGADGTCSSDSLGISAANFKGFKNELAMTTDASTDIPNVDGKYVSASASLKGPILNKNLSGSIKKPDIEGKLTSKDLDGPNLSLPSLDESANVHVSGVSQKNSSFDVDSASNDLSSLDGKLSSGLNGLNVELPDLCGKLNGTINTPNLDDNLPSAKNLKGETQGSVDDSGLNGSLPSTNADLKSPDVDFPKVHGKRDKTISTPHVTSIDSKHLPVDASLMSTNTDLPSIDRDLKSSDVDIDFNAKTDRPGVSGALDKLSARLVDMKEGITGQLTGSVDTDPKFSRKLSLVNDESSNPKLEHALSSYKVNASVDTPSIEGLLPDVADSPKKELGDHFSEAAVSVKGNGSGSPSARLPGVGSLRKISIPEVHADVPEKNAEIDDPVAPPRSPGLSLNKMSTSTAGSIKSPATNTEINADYKGLRFNLSVNDKPATTGLDSVVESDRAVNFDASTGGQLSGDISMDEKDAAEKPGSFFSKPLEKISGGINSFIGDDNDKRKDDESQENKTSANYAILKTRSRSESPNDLSAILDDIVKKRLSNTPSESDVQYDKRKSASCNSGSSEPSNNLSAGVIEPHSSIGGDRPRSVVSDSRFKELDESEGDVIDCSSPLTSTAVPKNAIPFVRLEKMVDASISPGQEPPQVPIHRDDQLQSPTKAHGSSNSLQSTSFRDCSTADAIKTACKMTSDNGTGHRVLKVRDGFENFTGFGVKCVSDNEDTNTSLSSYP
ncbi:hypothetical protein [Parasitella parasitica]|uniref:EF-hand domain-containing protein n=1 Tax=Parasitella parasitica TaxID=35722 RepID=A0A0B7NVX6_9FUNG|nr:hypothetical protein [Parasitella parasitica]